jgi:hypothetical protein
MNFRVQDGYSVILMSRRKDTPYNDHVEDEGRTLVAENIQLMRASQPVEARPDRVEPRQQREHRLRGVRHRGAF